MNCAHCQTPNPEGAKFCLNCGKALAAACPNCATPLAPGAKFCHNCGQAVSLQPYIPQAFAAKLEAARANRSMEGERRIVTILFCDVKGSTAMAEQLDPEEWTDIMNDAFEHLIAPVYHYEGTVARLLGDAILAFFGAPIAHEDDPQRAILAGLDITANIRGYREQITRERGLDFNVRVGINTGLVVVGEVGSDLRVEYTAMGDAVNLAARMEQTAQPGTVQISGNTHKLVAPLFEFEALGGIEVKGKSEPVPAYRVLGPKAQPGRLRGIEGLASPLIGREKEMNSLRGVVADLREGRGQIVSVMGEAGLGKSRLVAEWRAALVADGLSLIADGVSPIAEGNSGADTIGGTRYAVRDTPREAAICWYEGRSLSYETSTPYAPFVDLLGKLLGLRPEAPDAEKYEKVKARVAEVLPDRAAEVAPFIATLFGIKLTGEDAERVKYLEPPQLRGRVFHALSDFFERLAERQPLALVFEDLHWADPTSLDLIEQLMPLAERARLTIVALFRPHRQEPSWRFHEKAARDYAHHYTCLMLEPLDEGHARSLVAHLLHVEDLPEKVRALILKKAEGNPFFVEEVIRSLLDSRLVVRDDGHWRATREIENIAVPDTLAGVITARLDRLDEEAKRAAQTAAVIGREFPFDTVAMAFGEARPALDAALGTLQQRELIREKSHMPRPVYLFKHALTQETAYASLLLSKRRELHRRVAECLEQTEPEHVNDIARHWLEAQAYARALPYLVEAGDRAARAYSTPEAIGFYTRALEILQKVDDLALARRAYEGLGSALTLANDIPRAVENYHTMFHAAQAHGDIPMQISALNKTSWVVALRLGQFPEADQHLVDAERLAREYQDKAGLSELFTVRCMMCTAAADFESVVHYMGEFVQLGRELNVKEQMALGLEHIATTQIYMTQFEAAWQTAQEGLHLAREIGDRQHEAGILTDALPAYHLRNGDLEAARRAAEEGATLAAQIGAAYPEYTGAYALGQVAHLRGEYERARAWYQRALRLSRSAGFPWFEAMALCALGTAELDISAELLDRTVAFHTQALQVMTQPGGAMTGATAWAELGFCVLAAGNLDSAGEFFQKGLTLPTAPMYLERPRLLVGSAFLALARNQWDEAASLVGEARAFAEERAMKNLYPLVAFADARVSAARGEHDHALESYLHAEALALSMQMRPLVWQARAGAAQVLSTLGRQPEAEARRREARAMVDEIAGLFEDEKLRALYLESAASKIH